jgi:hypothetical protein
VIIIVTTRHDDDISCKYHGCRIWTIHAEESFAFSTKDRAPMLVCLEVIDTHRAANEKRYVVVLMVLFRSADLSVLIVFYICDTGRVSRWRFRPG